MYDDREEGMTGTCPLNLEVIRNFTNIYLMYNTKNDNIKIKQPLDPFKSIIHPLQNCDPGPPSESVHA